MKHLRIVAFLLVAVMLVAVFAGCEKVEKKEVTVHVTVKYADDPADDDEDPETVLDTDVTFQSEKPTALEALVAACEQLEMACEYDSTTGIVTKIDTYSEYEDAEAALSWYWSWMLNGAEVKNIKAMNQDVVDGDIVLYHFTSTVIDDASKDWKDPDATTAG